MTELGQMQESEQQEPDHSQPGGAEHKKEVNGGQRAPQDAGRKGRRRTLNLHAARVADCKEYSQQS
jgi:hypothetical protein